MVTARREHFGYLLEPGLQDIFYEVYDQMPSIINELYSVQTTDEPYVTDVSIGTLGDFPKFEGTVEYDRPYQQYKKIYDFPEYAKGFRIERKLYDDDRYDEINKQPQGLAISANRRRETHAAELFNKASDADVTGPDGVPLCSDEHPTKSPDGPAERSNLHSLTLDQDNLQTVKNSMRETLDDRGGRISVVPDTLLVPVDLEETAWSLIEAQYVVGTRAEGSQTNPNIHQGRYKLIVWDYLDGAGDDSPWFLIDSRYAAMFLKWYDRIPIEFAMEEDFDTLVAKFRAYMRYESGWSDWIWIHGSFPQ